MQISLRRVDVGGVTLNVAECGEGEPVLVLHGFPELWWGARRLLLGLARRGFRAIAPDLRGFGASDKPRDVRDFRTQVLLDDLEGLIRRRAGGRAAIVGHDWGGTLAYCLASEKPELVSRLVILNAPHPERLRELLFTRVQFLRSWYLFAFQLPWLPEWFVRQRRVVEWMFRGSAVRPDVFDDETITTYWAALNVTRAAKSAANYYRASFRWPVRALLPITTPTLVIWGENDPSLDVRLLDDLERFVTNLEIVRVENAGHFVQHEMPELIEELVVRHLLDTM